VRVTKAGGLSESWRAEALADEKSGTSTKAAAS
jgi:hypothetical protein